MVLNPFSALTSKIYGAVAIAALMAVTVQTVRVADRDATIAKLRDLFAQANANHRQTKINYRAAQAAAAELERRRLTRVLAEQQEISDEVLADYRRRLADARAAAERLRREASGAGARGAADAERLPGAGNTAGGAAGAPADPRLSLNERLIATEQAIQLDALIIWVREQLGVDPNR